ncbi:hypothetical protein F4810DRAFT_462141 [Camillea tinctor]|nr:hypothetical protein F4810DRAFT_462141 [Camillea tinctor]
MTKPPRVGRKMVGCFSLSIPLIPLSLARESHTGLFTCSTRQVLIQPSIQSCPVRSCIRLYTSTTTYWTRSLFLNSVIIRQSHTSFNSPTCTLSHSPPYTPIHPIYSFIHTYVHTHTYITYTLTNTQVGTRTVSPPFPSPFPYSVSPSPLLSSPLSSLFLPLSSLFLPLSSLFLPLPPPFLPPPSRLT